jgi:2'-hydroxyisoflavone reductase
MRILILGGTLFLGRHIAMAAVAQGHSVSVFNRGRTANDLPSEVSRLRGDRDNDVAALRVHRYDVAIDTSAYHPRHIETVAGALDRIRHYILVSTASVYSAFPADEFAPVHDPIWDDAVQPGPTAYAGLKRACEETALRRFGDRLTIVRPGVLVGPYDPTNRFEYWVRRAARGGQMLVPGDPQRRIQLLDARDLATWMLHAAGGVVGILNAAGPQDDLTMSGFMSLCIEAARSDVQPVWVSDEFLLEHNVTPWSDLPLWIPTEAGPLLELDWSRAQQAGLSPRPLAETIRDVLKDPSPRHLLAGGMRAATPIDADTEHELLHDWFTTAPPNER